MPAGGLQYPGTDAPDGPGSFGQRDKGLREDHALARMAPADQRLVPHDAAGAFDLRLVMQLELMLMQRRAQLIQQLRQLRGPLRAR